MQLKRSKSNIYQTESKLEGRRFIFKPQYLALRAKVNWEYSTVSCWWVVLFGLLEDWGLNNDKNLWLTGQPLFQTVMQEKKHSLTVLSSSSTHSVISTPVFSAEADVPTCAGTNMSADPRYNHCIFGGGRKELWEKKKTAWGQKLPTA